MLGKRSGALKRFFSLVTGLPLLGLRSYKSVFGRLCRKTVPRGGKTRGSCTEKRCSHKWFHMIFPCTDSCTNTFCTSSRLHPPSPPETQKALRTWRRLFALFEAIRSWESLYKFCHCSSLSQLMMLALGNSEKCSRCIQTHTPFTVGSH